jgi:hypothetical protein
MILGQEQKVENGVLSIKNKEVISKIKRKYKKNVSMYIRFYKSGIPESHWVEHRDELLINKKRPVNTVFFGNNRDSERLVSGELMSRVVHSGKRVIMLNMYELFTHLVTDFGKIRYSNLNTFNEYDLIVLTHVKYGKAFDDNIVAIESFLSYVMSIHKTLYMCLQRVNDADISAAYGVVWDNIVDYEFDIVKA